LWHVAVVRMDEHERLYFGQDYADSGFDKGRSWYLGSRRYDNVRVKGAGWKLAGAARSSNFSRLGSNPES
jgi:hypothetical protein